MTDPVDAFTKQICEVIVGKNQAVKLAVASLLARGHLLIEDIPGVGKTTLAQALARSLALAFQRIQFTSDLLPADILGNSIFDRGEQRFVFHRGPLFAQMVLIDEVNRATAKTQSALLEAMERLVRSRTTFIITHRLSALKHCDMVVRIEKGRLIAIEPDTRTVLQL